MFYFLAVPTGFDAIQYVVWFSSWNLCKKYNNGLFILRTRARYIPARTVPTLSPL